MIFTGFIGDSLLKTMVIGVVMGTNRRVCRRGKVMFTMSNPHISDC